MENERNLKFSKIVALIFALWTVYEVFAYVRYGFYIQYFKIFRIIAFAFIAYATYRDRRDISIAKGYTILLAVRLWYFFVGWKGQYWVETSAGEHFSFVAMLPALLDVAAGLIAVFIALALFTEYLPKCKEAAKKIWILPSAFIVATVVTAQLVHFLFNGAWWNEGSYINIENVILRLMYATLYLVGMMYVAYPDGLKRK